MKVTTKYGLLFIWPVKFNRLRFKINPITVSLLIICNFIIFGCSETPKKSTPEVRSLQDAFSKDFYVGVAINGRIIDQTDSLSLNVVKKEFNSITAENIMKSMNIHPKRDSFNFEMADKFVSLGEEYDMFIHGHTLIWHSQLSPWFSTIEDSLEFATATKKHVKDLAQHFRGKVDSWDVVNEALNEDGTLRNSIFLKKMGEEYLPSAFKWTAEVDPNADLYYNDYNMTNPDKRQGAISMVKKIKEQGGKVDGIGMQGHWHLNSPSLEEIEQSILDYSALGVKVAITELDVSVLPNPWDLEGAEISQNFENNERMNPYTKGLPDSVQVQLANRYKDIFNIFLKHRDKISRVTFWGLGDGQSWLNGFPIRGRTNYPLLFDRDLRPKAAYDSIMALKERFDQQPLANQSK
ncbi:endo-1,4-beta-xylanase [Maribacter sp. PR1]|uniref:Beta-xylanase n=1 Tax=Maribacter cobaltidurans TaxID=1178778 RepID=A0ABU7IPF9_9FLAO|nr:MULTISPECIES: endo-1,4-beta-xylanase [Maribacter]MDC6387445.1 endo-1,4-beta-xylanase [Maribacter sp. PR1]MEE1974832.1 endo-1,4-beta-xylanase [Maribacter cobaltidurans]